MLHTNFHEFLQEPWRSSAVFFRYSKERKEASSAPGAPKTNLDIQDPLGELVLSFLRAHDRCETIIESAHS